MLVYVITEENNKIVAKAPKYFYTIEKGDFVMVESQFGTVTGVVEEVLPTYYSDEPELEDFIASIVRCGKPFRKVVKVAKWNDVIYPSEESEVQK